MFMHTNVSTAGAGVEPATSYVASEYTNHYVRSVVITGYKKTQKN
jgi:hypothetical protein